MRNVLAFIELLELAIFNSTGFGAGMRIPNAPKASVQFFHGNKKVCDDWFAKMRKLLVMTSRVVGAHVSGWKHLSSIMQTQLRPQGISAENIVDKMRSVDRLTLEGGAVFRAFPSESQFLNFLWKIAAFFLRLNEFDHIFSISEWRSKFVSALEHPKDKNDDSAKESRIPPVMKKKLVEEELRYTSSPFIQDLALFSNVRTSEPQWIAPS